MTEKEWPRCQRCNKGVLLPLSDYGPQGNDIPFKLWVCHNPACGFSLRIDKGQVTFGRPVRPEQEAWEPRR
ncbi:MAG: hypothetical protein ACRERD_34135 [Candidatus Binatia bacterium]